jgi:hypothetical protein
MKLMINFEKIERKSILRHKTENDDQLMLTPWKG